MILPAKASWDAKFMYRVMIIVRLVILMFLMAPSVMLAKNRFIVVFKNCHTFSTKCVNYAPYSPSLFQKVRHRFLSLFDSEWEASIRMLKHTAGERLGATTWRLWDWDNSAKNTPEPDWQAQNDFFKQQALTPDFIKALRIELGDLLDYEDEIKDDTIPDDIRKKLQIFRKTLVKISNKYDEVAEFLTQYPNAGFCYEDLIQCQDTDFVALAKELQNNTAIKNLVNKLGRNYISQERKNSKKSPKPIKAKCMAPTKAMI